LVPSRCPSFCLSDHPSTEQELDMIFASPPASRRTLLCLSALFLPGCAGTLPEVGPGDIPRLEQRVAASPDDTGLQVQLGMAQFKAGDFEAARGNLQSAIEGGNDSGAAYLYLGMVQEELEDWSAAREAYTTYLEVGASTEGRGEVRKRLTLIGRNLLRAQARQALAQEAEITSTASVTPRSVAVLPLGFNSANSDLEPLIYALAGATRPTCGLSTLTARRSGRSGAQVARPLATVTRWPMTPRETA
jgi:tetratricopeptide (TPR) repeat protein